MFNMPYYKVFETYNEKYWGNGMENLSKIEIWLSDRL